MTKISKIIAAATSLAVLGLAAIPAVGYAAGTTNTAVEVTIGAECLIGDGSNTSGESLLEVSLDATDPALIDGGNVNASIDITCNQSWTLSERAANNLASPTNSLAMKTDDATPGTYLYDGAVGFNALAAPVAASATPLVDDLDNFTANTWGMAYTGTDVDVTDWHTPGLVNGAIATGTATAKSSIVQYFGAKTDNSVPQGTYGAVVTYTLAP